MNCKSNTKIIAAFAVLAMMFAGFGVFLTAESNDAADNTGDIIITFEYDSVIPYAAGEDASIFAPGVIKYKAIFDEANFDNISVVYYDTYNNYVKPYVTYEIINDEAVPVAYFTADEFMITDLAFKKVIEILTAGVDDAIVSSIVFDMSLAQDLVIDAGTGVVAKADGLAIAAAFAAVPEGYVSVEAAEAAIAEAVAIAVAETEAQYADYLSPEEVQLVVEEAVIEALSHLSDYIYTQDDLDKAVAKAIADTKAIYADYKSPAEVQEIVDKAIEDYKAANPVKTDDTYLYCFIVALAVAIIFAGLFAYFVFIKPKLAAPRRV